MSTTPTFAPINLARVAWIEKGRRAQFSAARPGWGVVNTATGEVIAHDGTTPSVWSSKGIAAVIAENPPAWPTITITREERPNGR